MTKLKLSRAQLRELVACGIDDGEDLLLFAREEVSDQGFADKWTEDYERWVLRIKAALVAAVEDVQLADEFNRAATDNVFRWVSQTENDTFTHRIAAMRRGVNTLRSIEERAEFFEEPGEVLVDPRPAAHGGKQVFVVHGRNDVMREQVARLLERLELEAIILHEQTDRGRTILEKFEQHALEVGYAVVLISPDDYARSPDEADWPAEPNRARQNVILELGYFMGTLRRERTAALYVRGTELPSDIHGLLYIPFEADWQLRLAKEMRDAGLNVDLNKL